MLADAINLVTLAVLRYYLRIINVIGTASPSLPTDDWVWQELLEMESQE